MSQQPKGLLEAGSEADLFKVEAVTPTSGIWAIHKDIVLHAIIDPEPDVGVGIGSAVANG